MKIIESALIILLGGIFGLAAGAEELRVYPEPPVPLVYSAHNDDFTVRVRTPGGEWQDLYEYNLRVDWDKPQNASLVYFDFDGTVEVEVQKNNGTFDAVTSLPVSAVSQLKMGGKIVHFTLTHPTRFSLQFDDDRLHNLHILAGNLPTKRPVGAGVRYFDPGLHVPDDGGKIFHVSSGDVIYLDGGAILTGNFDLRDVHDVRILGRGLILNSGRAIEIDHSQNISLADFITLNDDKEAAARVANIRHSNDIHVDGISGFTAGKWADGLNISTSQNISVNGVYLRTSDDAVVVYAVSDCPICANKIDQAPSSLSFDTYNIRVTNSTIWSDVAHAMYVGHFGDNMNPRNVHDVHFDNIDVLNLDEDDEPWEGAMAIYAGDSTRISNISFTSIRVARIEEGKLIHVIAGNSPRYNTAPGRGVENILFRDVSFTGDGLPSASIIAGYSTSVTVNGVVLENLAIAGEAARTPKAANLKVGPYVTGWTIKP